MEKVQSPDFWKERLEETKLKNQPDYWSVYKTNIYDWFNICFYHKRIIDKLVKGKVLDAGCGYGRLSEWISDYTGVDIADVFIGKAKEIYPNGKFIKSDLKELPFKDKEFDWAVCVSIKGMIKRECGNNEWEKIEQELKRVAEQILILEYSSPDKYEVINNNS